MTGSEAKQIIDACNEKNINFTVVTMMPTFMRKNENTVVKVVDENIYAFRKPIFAENNGVSGIELMIMPVEQLCEFHINGSYEDMESLAEDLGLDLTEEELATLIHMDKYDAPIEPETGDYNRFRYITGKAYDLLTDEEKEAYEEAKTKYEEEKAKKLGKNQAASISMY